MAVVSLDIPIKNLDKYFYNRKKDIERIEYYLNSLEMDISQSLLIRGVRGVGKTFLLFKLKQDLKKNFLVSYIDISWVCRNDKDIQSVLLALLGELNDTVYKWLDDDNKINFFLKIYLINKNLKILLF